MIVKNPGGSLKLEVTYTIFSKLPIERADVETDANANYQVAKVCLESKLTQESYDRMLTIRDESLRKIVFSLNTIKDQILIDFQDYRERNDTPNGVVEISDGDDLIESESWNMKKHDDGEAFSEGPFAEGFSAGAYYAG